MVCCTIWYTPIEHFGAERFLFSAFYAIYPPTVYIISNFRALPLILPPPEMFSDIHRGFVGNTCDSEQFIKAC